MLVGQNLILPAIESILPFLRSKNVETVNNIGSFGNFQNFTLKYIHSNIKIDFPPFLNFALKKIKLGPLPVGKI